MKRKIILFGVFVLFFFFLAPPCEGQELMVGYPAYIPHFVHDDRPGQVYSTELVVGVSAPATVELIFTDGGKPCPAFRFLVTDERSEWFADVTGGYFSLRVGKSASLRTVLSSTQIVCWVEGKAVSAKVNLTAHISYPAPYAENGELLTTTVSSEPPRNCHSLNAGFRGKTDAFQFSTGVAVVNLNRTEAVRVKAVLLDAGGSQVLSPVEVHLAPAENKTFFIHELFEELRDREHYQGTMLVSSTSSTAVTGVRFTYVRYMRDGAEEQKYFLDYAKSSGSASCTNPANAVARGICFLAKDETAEERKCQLGFGELLHYAFVWIDRETEANNLGPWSETVTPLRDYRTGKIDVRVVRGEQSLAYYKKVSDAAPGGEELWRTIWQEVRTQYPGGMLIVVQNVDRFALAFLDISGMIAGPPSGETSWDDLLDLKKFFVSHDCRFGAGPGGGIEGTLGALVHETLHAFNVRHPHLLLSSIVPGYESVILGYPESPTRPTANLGPGVTDYGHWMDESVRRSLGLACRDDKPGFPGTAVISSLDSAGLLKSSAR